MEKGQTSEGIILSSHVFDYAVMCLCEETVFGADENISIIIIIEKGQTNQRYNTV